LLSGSCLEHATYAPVAVWLGQTADQHTRSKALIGHPDHFGTVAMAVLSRYPSLFFDNPRPILDDYPSFGAKRWLHNRFYVIGADFFVGKMWRLRALRTLGPQFTGKRLTVRDTT
jgi:hypothetical protein